MTKELHPGLGSGALRERLCERITSYLTLGGLFNAELANHDAVRELLFDCRVGLSLSSPIEPAQHDHDHFDSQPCPICRDRSVAQASSEVREALVELCTMWEAEKETEEPTERSKWYEMALRRCAGEVRSALAPSRQGAAKRVEG